MNIQVFANNGMPLWSLWTQGAGPCDVKVTMPNAAIDNEERVVVSIHGPLGYEPKTR